MQRVIPCDRSGILPTFVDHAQICAAAVDDLAECIPGPQKSVNGMAEPAEDVRAGAAPDDHAGHLFRALSDLSRPHVGNA